MQNGSEFTNSSLQKCDSEEKSEPMFATTFDHLPNELQLKIFSYLTTAELCRYVAPVCREWREKAKDPVLWKVIVLKDVHVDYLDKFCRILTRATMLKCLTLRALSCPLQDFARCSLSFPLLTHLDLGFCNDVNPQIISIFVSNCRLISVLNVEGCLGINQAAVNIISTLKYLRSLNLSHCTFLSNPAIVRLAKNCPRLQELNVDGITRITDSAICLLCENLQDSLRHIELDGEELTDKSYKCIGQCRHLIKLGISFAEMITDRSLMYLKKLSKLHYLKLRRGTHLTAPALKDIFVGPELKYLTFLEFDSLMIEDDGIKSMTECMYKSNNYPESWNSATLMMIYKNGDQSSPENYRPIALLSTIWKCFTSILARKFQLWMKTMELEAEFQKCIYHKQRIFIQHDVKLCVYFLYKKLSKLHYLKLRRGTHLTAPALKDIFVGPELKYLTFLEFDSLMIEDDGIKSMTECCTELRYLGLQWCWKITDVGLDFIVTNCHNLRGIDLLGLYRITGTALLKVPSNMKHLGYLNLEQCNEVNFAFNVKNYKVILYAQAKDPLHFCNNFYELCIVHAAIIAEVYRGQDKNLPATSEENESISEDLIQQHTQDHSGEPFLSSTSVQDSDNLLDTSSIVLRKKISNLIKVSNDKVFNQITYIKEELNLIHENLYETKERQTKMEEFY
ncbi:uncharacterized protein LOC111623004 [Centruroides sculpturatus]|uniref:uncharacterized protein LOC111623004 n=1 Tax=Centruroides sculpturatus TaxID=218467 RepID=UPI000C6CDCB7|nr:uncharacterized protein LOC111623004 [Centruroides sculpturatus]